MQIPVTNQFIIFFRYQFYILESQKQDQIKHLVEGLIHMPSYLQSSFHLQTISNNVWHKTWLQQVGCPWHKHGLIDPV